MEERLDKILVEFEKMRKQIEYQNEGIKQCQKICSNVNLIELNKGKNEISIQLKNLDLKHITTAEQLEKVKEEEIEFMVAIELENKANAIEEFYDAMQSKLGLTEKLFGI